MRSTKRGGCIWSRSATPAAFQVIADTVKQLTLPSPHSLSSKSIYPSTEKPDQSQTCWKSICTVNSICSETRNEGSSWWETTPLLRWLFLKCFPSYFNVNKPWPKTNPLSRWFLLDFYGGQKKNEVPHYYCTGGEMDSSTHCISVLPSHLYYPPTTWHTQMWFYNQKPCTLLCVLVILPWKAILVALLAVVITCVVNVVVVYLISSPSLSSFSFFFSSCCCF